jgi:hypothetical protein
MLSRIEMKRTLRGVAALALVASLLTGCSKTVVIPREDLANERYRQVDDYRVKLHGWNEYHARRFSVTDSTVVIEELKPSDDRYKLKRHDMPIVIPRAQVEYVGVMETNKPVTAVVLIGLGAGAAWLAWLFVAFSGGSGF